jgi:hypothetical protein
VELKRPNIYSKDDILDLKKDINDFKIAFGVIDWATLNQKDDPNYVHWRVSVKTLSNFRGI